MEVFCLATPKTLRLRLATIVALCAVACGVPVAGRAATVTVNGSQQFQVIDGLGVNANAASWNSGELRPALDLLADQLGATLWRVVFEMADWEATNDNADPATFNWTYYNSVYTSQRLEELWNTLAYLNQKGITSGIILNFMGRVPPWMGGAQINSTSEDEWVEMIASLVYYARVTRGLQFGMLAPTNEPDWDGIEGPQVPAAQYVRLLRKLAQRLDGLGLGDIRLVGPDTAAIDTGVGSYMPEMMRDPIVMAKLDHFGFHNYAGNTGGADAAIRSSAYPTRNFWMTEVTNIWDALPELGQGAAAYLVWDAYDSVYNHAILAGRGSTPPNDTGNGPPLLSYNSASRTYTPRKAFYEHAQLFRFVDPGSRRIGVTGSGANLTVYAFHHSASGRVSIVGRSTASSPTTITGALTNLPAVSTLAVYQTDRFSANLQRGPDVPVTNGSFSVTISPNSVFTLTTVSSATGLPAAPTNLQVTPNATQLMVTWTDNSTNETGFQVERRTGTTGAFAQIATPGSNSSSYTDSGPAGGTTYCYRVRAFNASGNSTYSNVACTTAPQTFTLTVPKAGSGTGTVSSMPAGIMCGTDCSELYATGTVVTLSATPATGSTFAGWTGGGCSGTATCRVTLTANSNVTATFTATSQAHSLAVSRAGTGSGSVTSNPPGINCGATCSASYATGTVVTLTAAPATGSTFAGWTGGGCSGTATCRVTLTGNTNVTATFTVTSQAYSLTVSRAGTGSGTVSSNPPGIDCGTACSATYASGTVVTLTAAPAGGSTFTGWTGGGCTGAANCQVTLAANTTVTASFTTGTATSPPGLMAAYGFNEASGNTVFDASGKGNTGTISGATRTTSGRFGGALAFNGINNWVTIPDSPALDLTTGMTLSAWVYPTVVPADWRAVILKEQPGQLVYALYASSDTNQASGYVYVNRDQGINGGSRLQANTWTHLAATYDGSVLRLYVNGVQVGSLTLPGRIQTSTGLLRIGGNSVWGEYFQGRIDDVRIYNRALTANEIQSDMNTPVSP